MRLIFHGAAGEVTGSCYLVDTGELKFLVDCGMFQGGRAADARNRRFAFDPRAIAFVLLSRPAGAPRCRRKVRQRRCDLQPVTIFSGTIGAWRGQSEAAKQHPTN